MNNVIVDRMDRPQRRVAIASALDIIPGDMDFNDGCI